METTGALKHLCLFHKTKESTLELAKAIDAQTFFISLPAATCTASRA